MDISISQRTFDRLQRHAKPLVDDVDELINRILDVFETANGGHSYLIEDADLWSAPSLTHAKFISAQFDGRPCDARDWNGLARELAIVGKRRLFRLENVFERLSVNHKSGEHTDRGYVFVPELGASIQSVTANQAARGACRLAIELGCELRIVFCWRDNADAAFPKARGEISTPVAEPTIGLRRLGDVEPSSSPRTPSVRRPNRGGNELWNLAERRR